MFDLGIVERIVKTGLFDTGYTRGDFAHSLVMLSKGGPLVLETEGAESEYASDITDVENYNDIVTVIKLGYMTRSAL